MHKATDSGADICVFDLEDSVPPRRLDEARIAVGLALTQLAGRGRLWVRVHAASTTQMRQDVAALPLDRIDGIVLPKVDHPDDIDACHAAIAASGYPRSVPVIAIIESARGVLNCQAIAQAPSVYCLALGRFDLAADHVIDPEVPTPAVAAGRALVVLASGASSLVPPLESPWLKIHDFDGLRHTAKQGRIDGFGGMLLVHPAHVEIVNMAFSDTDHDVAWAREIIKSSDIASTQGRGAFVWEGQMVDEAIVRRARRILGDATD